MVSCNNNGSDEKPLNPFDNVKSIKYTLIKINPVSGQITGKIDLSSLHQNALIANNKAEVSNGIAYDFKTDQMYVTGKLWPFIYIIKI